MAISAFRADPYTRSELGQRGLEELSRNLWLGRCQTCGAELSSEPPDMPVVVMVDSEIVVTASLHHQRCQRPRWTSHAFTGVRRFVSTTAGLTWVPFGEPGRTPPVPTLIANPGLEEVTLARTTAGRYRATTVDSYRPLGFVRPGALLPLADPEHVESWLTDQSVIVRCADRFWAIPMDGTRDPLHSGIRQCGELVFGLSTALDPAHMVNPEPIKRVLRASDIALVRVALSDDPAPSVTGSGVIVDSEFAHADESRDIDWLPDISPYPGSTYDPSTGRFQAGMGMDGPNHWRLNTPGSGVHNGLIVGTPGTGKTNVLRVVTIEALASLLFCYALADPLDRNGLADSLGTAAESVALNTHDAVAQLRGLDAMIAVRARTAERYRDPSAEYPGMLLVMDDAQEVLRIPEAAALAERIAITGPQVCVGLVVACLSVDPHDYGGRIDLVRALSDPNAFVFNEEQFRQLRQIQAEQRP